MTRWSQLAKTHGDTSYFKLQYDVAKKNNYLFSPRIYNADDYAIGQLYLDLYKEYQEPEMIIPLKVIFDIIIQTPSTVSLNFEIVKQKSLFDKHAVDDEFGGREFPLAPCKNRWCWADALFMGPPVWIDLAKQTGDTRYLDFADKEFWATVNFLWDKEDHLFFRDSRFFDKREKNGEKVIWARGVGWVAAGLARILENLPQDHSSRAQYEDIFHKMMTRLASAQQSDGLWRPSVLAPESKPFKESSGTALMAFAFASGINQGVLDKEEFLPVVRKAWSALVDAVQPNGQLGWVQQIGNKPDNVSAEDTQIYAVGAYLLTGSEVYKLSKS
jgi:rhamnogalacturonyl hydrolase YesR